MVKAEHTLTKHDIVKGEARIKCPHPDCKGFYAKWYCKQCLTCIYHCKG